MIGTIIVGFLILWGISEIICIIEEPSEAQRRRIMGVDDDRSY